MADWKKNKIKNCEPSKLNSSGLLASTIVLSPCSRRMSSNGFRLASPQRLLRSLFPTFNYRTSHVHTLRTKRPLRVPQSIHRITKTKRKLVFVAPLRFRLLYASWHSIIFPSKRCFESNVMISPYFSRQYSCVIYIIRLDERLWLGSLD